MRQIPKFGKVKKFMTQLLTHQEGSAPIAMDLGMNKNICFVLRFMKKRGVRTVTSMIIFILMLFVQSVITGTNHSMLFYENM